MRVTTRGRVTIPVEIRRRLGIVPGAEVEFEVEGDAVKMVPVRKAHARGQEIVARLRGKGTVSLTTDEIMALTRSG